MNDLQENLEILRTQKSYLKEAYHVKEIGIFGSFVHGDFTEKSDVDVLVDFSEPIDLFQYVELEEYLSNRLGRKVDLVQRSGLKRAIKKPVLASTVYV